MYLVTAAHSTAPGQADDLRLPWGEWHARRIGSLQAVCGRSAVTWQYFWTLDFSAAGSRACPECLRVVREEGARRARHPGSDASGADPGDARKAR